MSNINKRTSIFITLTEQDYNHAMVLGEQRHNAKNLSFRNNNIYMKNLNETDFSLPHKVGILGEIAYATFSNTIIDSNIYDIRDSGIDFGLDVEVKTITYMGDNPELKIKLVEFNDLKRKPKKYVLCRYNKNKNNIVELLGEISREDFETYKIKKQYNGQQHENYVVGIEHLRTVTPIKMKA